MRGHFTRECRYPETREREGPNQGERENPVNSINFRPARQEGTAISGQEASQTVSGTVQSSPLMALASSGLQS